MSFYSHLNNLPLKFCSFQEISLELEFNRSNVTVSWDKFWYHFIIITFHWILGTKVLWSFPSCNCIHTSFRATWRRWRIAGIRYFLQKNGTSLTSDIQDKAILPFRVSDVQNQFDVKDINHVHTEIENVFSKLNLISFGTACIYFSWIGFMFCEAIRSYLLLHHIFESAYLMRHSELKRLCWDFPLSNSPSKHTPHSSSLLKTFYLT